MSLGHSDSLWFEIQIRISDGCRPLLELRLDPPGLKMSMGMSSDTIPGPGPGGGAQVPGLLYTSSP